MKETALILHILIAFSSMLIAIVGLLRNRILRTKTEALFIPSVLLTSLSGVGLIVFGGSFTRACVSGVATISVLFSLRYVSVKIAAYETINRK